MPVKGCMDQAVEVRDTDPPIPEGELKQMCRFVNKLAATVSEAQVIHRGNPIKIIIKGDDITLECIDKKASCAGPSAHYRMPDGRPLHVCPRLTPLADQLTVTRKLAFSRKVGRYRYKLQLQDGHQYWYLQFTEAGKSKPLYLGKDEPTFEPRKDIQRAKRRRARRQKQVTAAAPHGA
jgi:hypothetical protein